MVGTIVRDSRYEASMANATASASGVNRNFGGPSRNSTDTNTMLIVSVETNVGPAICGSVEDRLAQRLSEADIAVDVFDFHGRIVDQNADRQSQPTQASSRSTNAPSRNSITIDDRIASGIETATMQRAAQLPRNTRIIVAVSSPAMMLS